MGLNINNFEIPGSKIRLRIVISSKSRLIFMNNEDRSKSVSYEPIQLKLMSNVGNLRMKKREFWNNAFSATFLSKFEFCDKKSIKTEFPVDHKLKFSIVKN